MKVLARSSLLRRLMILLALVVMFSFSRNAAAVTHVPCCLDCYETFESPDCSNIPPGTRHTACVNCYSNCSTSCGCDPAIYPYWWCG